MYFNFFTPFTPSRIENARGNVTLPLESPTNVGDLTSILGMEKSDSRSLRSSANPISLCCEQGGPHFGWDAPTCLLHPKPEWRLNRPHSWAYNL